MKRTSFFLMVFICLFLSRSFGQTNVQSTASGTWTKYGSPYMVTSAVEVGSGSSLTIEPGVVVQFSDQGSLLIHGTMKAVGNSSNWITFTKSGSNKWKGIAFDNTMGSNSMIFCKVEFADYPSFSSSYGALTVSQSNVSIKNCIITDNGGVGLHYINSPNQTVDHCTFANNSNTDLYAPKPNPSNPKVKNCIFWGSPRSIDNTCEASASYCSFLESKIPDNTSDIGHNIFGINPYFVNDKSGDYRLSSSSPFSSAGENGTEMGAYGGGSNYNVTTNNNGGGGRYVPQPQRR